MVRSEKTWYVKENNFAISLPQLHVALTPIDKAGVLLTVTDGERIQRGFSLPSIESAIEFTEKYIYRCKSIKEVHEQYMHYSDVKYDEWNTKVSR